LLLVRNNILMLDAFEEFLGMSTWMNQ